MTQAIVKRTPTPKPIVGIDLCVTQVCPLLPIAVWEKPQLTDMYS